MELNPSKFYIEWYSIIIFYIILIMIIAISGFILKPNARIMNEINALEKLLVLLRQNQINKTIEIYKKYFMEERKMDSTENTPDLNKCPLSVESWVTILDNEIYNLRYPDLAVLLSPILIFSIAFFGYTIESIDGPLESVFVSIWAKIMGILIVITVIAVIYFIICSYKTYKKRQDFETLRGKIIFEDLTDSNIIREEWKKVRDSRFCLLWI